MKKIKKILTLILFTCAIVLSAIFTGKVIINYNLSDYLANDTQTKIALNIIEEEFETTGNVQVMVKNVEENKLDDIKDTLSDISYVLNVNFDKYDENYYKNNNALYIVIIDGDDYSLTAKQVTSDIKDALKEYENVEYGGTSIEKQALQEAITSEMTLIITIALCLVLAILLITSSSWIEPIILLVSSGVAVLINKGTNFFFGEISYITNSISAILQLALSIDYSIVLLHTYRSKKEKISDNDMAMKEAIKSVIRPISASALTTIAGLLALLFMSFKIGFDIGIVLIKGIVISCITSLTLLPVLIVMCDKLLLKTKKKAFEPKGKVFYKTSIKANKIIVPIALILICLCGYLQSNNSYIFTDTKTGNEQIINNFGQNNSVVVVYKNTANNYENEKKLIDSINSKYSDEKVLASYSAYTNTVREEYDLTKATQKLELSEDEAKLLFTMYNLYNNNDLVTLKTNDFIEYANVLLNNDEDAKLFVDEDSKDIIEKILKVNNIMESDNTAKEFYNKLNNLNMDINDLSRFSIEQMYGLYFYDTVNDKEVDFKTMLNFIINASNNENIKDMFDDETALKLTQLYNGILQFEAQMQQPLTKEQLKGYVYQNYSILLDDATLTELYTAYYVSKNEEIKETIPFLNIFTFMVENNAITDESIVNTINNYNLLYLTINNKYAYDKFLDVLSLVAYSLTNQVVEINVSTNEIKQLYILYFDENNLIEYDAIKGGEFINFILNEAKNNELVNNQIKNNKEKLNDMLTINSFMNDNSKYTYKEMNSKLNELKNNIESQETFTVLDSEKVSGVYIKYAINNNLSTCDSMMAYELLDFVNSNKDSNSLMIKKLDDNKRDKINEANNDLNKANDLFVGENYSRLLLSINLDNGGEKTTEFVSYLSKEVKDIFGEDAYIAGEIVSTYDLKQSFAHDNLFITIFTLISIFVIVMLTFKSLSLPTILVAIIQGAIFIAMSTQLLNNEIFFMSYIVVTCILMGATIDYGILMSSNYVANRYHMSKEQSLENAISTSMPTIFTSGLILTICGFVIHFVSSQNSIATVGLLLGIGTICSVVMITIVLPSTLYLLDKFVMKLTIKSRQN